MIHHMIPYIPLVNYVQISVANKQLPMGLHRDGKTIRRVRWDLILCFMALCPSPKGGVSPQKHFRSS